MSIITNQNHGRIKDTGNLATQLEGDVARAQRKVDMERAAAGQWACEWCGQVNRSGAAFCRKCGAKPIEWNCCLCGHEGNVKGNCESCGHFCGQDDVVISGQPPASYSPANEYKSLVSSSWLIFAICIFFILVGIWSIGTRGDMVAVVLLFLFGSMFIFLTIVSIMQERKKIAIRVKKYHWIKNASASRGK